jgi:hypothetical protein
VSSGCAAPLERLRRQVRFGIWIEGAAVLVLTFGACALVSFCADRLLRLEVGYRLALLLVMVALLARAAYRRLVRPLATPLSDDDLALAIERSDATLHQRLISAVQFQRALRGGGAALGESPALMQAVVEEADGRAASLPLERAIDWRRVHRHGLALAAALLAFAAAAALAPSKVALWVARNLGLSAVDWPHDTVLAFADAEGGVLRVPQGDDVVIEVRASGVVPEQVTLYCAFAGHEVMEQAMTRLGESSFTTTIETLLEDARVHAAGGDGRTADLLLEVVERPRLEDLRVTLVSPEYTGRPAEVIDASRTELQVLRGSSLQLEVRSTKPLASGRVQLAETAQPLVVTDGGRAAAASLMPEESGLLTIDAIDGDGMTPARAPVLSILMVEDRAPEVRFDAEGIGVLVTPEARIPGRVSARDDYAVRSLFAQVRTTATAENATPPEQAPPAESPWTAVSVDGLDRIPLGSAHVEGPVAIDLREIALPAEQGREATPALQPGQFLALRFGAMDSFAPGEPHTGTSEPAVFHVVSRERLLEDLMRRRGEQRREIELVLAAERAALVEIDEMGAHAGAPETSAGAARTRLETVSREQRALGKRVAAAADAYAQILDEVLNNRVLEPAEVTGLRERITTPLGQLAAEGFPAAAAATQDFAASGTEEQKSATKLRFAANVRSLELVLAEMEQAESFATLLEGLRETIKLQGEAMRAAEQRRREELDRLFGEPRPRAGSEPKK